MPSVDLDKVEQQFLKAASQLPADAVGSMALLRDHPQALAQAMRAAYSCASVNTPDDHMTIMASFVANIITNSVGMIEGQPHAVLIAMMMYRINNMVAAQIEGRVRAEVSGTHDFSGKTH